jgi:hypothetical protein
VHRELDKMTTQAAHTARHIIQVGPDLGLRPCEWDTIEVLDQIVRVRSAKQTNGRAAGETREIAIERSADASALLASVIELAKMIRGCSVLWELMQRRVNYVLRMAAMDCGMQAHPSLSTFRHIAISRWKCAHGVDDVARLAGHASNATACQHYGRARSGRKWPRVHEPPVQLPHAVVRNKLRCYTRNAEFTSAATSTPSPRM